MEEQMEGQIGRVEGQTNWQTEGRMKGEIEIGIAKYEGSAEPTTVAIRHKPIKKQRIQNNRRTRRTDDRRRRTKRRTNGDGWMDERTEDMRRREGARDGAERK